MNKRIAVRIASFLFALCLLVTGGLIPSFAAGSVVVPAGGTGKHSYINITGGGSLGQRIHVNGSFDAIRLRIATFLEKGADADISVYNWDTSYAKTVSAEPVATKTFVDIVNDSQNWFEFGKELPAGEYLFLLHNQKDAQVASYIYESNGVSKGCAYHNGGLMVIDMDYAVRFTEAVDEPFLPIEIPKYTDVNAYDQNAAREATQATAIGQRVHTNATMAGFSYFIPTWTHKDTYVTVSIFKWNLDYSTTMKGEELYRKRMGPCPDNTNHVFSLDTPLPAGDYFFVIHEVDGTAGTYLYKTSSVSKGFAYVNGIETEGDLMLSIRFEGDFDEPFVKCEGVEDMIDGTHTPPAEYVIPEDSKIYTHPVMPDTWVFTDGLGRVSLTNAEVGDPRDDKTVAMFFWDWHSHDNGVRAAVNVQQLIEKYPEAINDYNHKAWRPTSAAWYWNEPIYGYYQSTDAWVARRQGELLANAGIDTIFTDNTNYTMVFKEGYDNLYETWTQAMEDGVLTPKISYMFPFAAGTDTRTQLRSFYLDVYRFGKYQHLWFYWDGKPMVSGYKSSLDTSDIVDKEISNFFTFRANYPGYIDSRENSERLENWGWLSMYPQAIYYADTRSLRQDRPEQITVGIAQNHNYVKHALTAMNGENVSGRSYTSDYQNRYEVEGDNASLYGYNFSEQWEYALEVDPKLVFVTGWNEWTASRFEEWPGSSAPVKNALGDTFCDEFSRDIEPSRGALKDHYYYLLVNYVRKYKGARPIPTPSSKATIDLAAGQEQWAAVEPYYAAYYGNTGDRDAAGRAGYHYTDYSGRNDIVGSKVARDDEFVYFLVECAENITPYTDNLWMNLYIDTDQSENAVGWESFEYIVNKTKASENTSVLERFTGEGYASEKVADVEYKVDGRFMTVKIAKSDLGLSGDDFTINFAWTDNVHDVADTGTKSGDEVVYTAFSGDILDFYTSGDVAPGGRFKFSYISTADNSEPTEGTTEETTTAESPETTVAPETTVEETTVDNVADTEAPAEETTVDAESAGCKSSVGLASAVAMTVAAVGAAVALKKKEDNP